MDLSHQRDYTKEKKFTKKKNYCLLPPAIETQSLDQKKNVTSEFPIKFTASEFPIKNL